MQHDACFKYTKKLRVRGGTDKTNPPSSTLQIIGSHVVAYPRRRGGYLAEAIWTERVVIN